MSEVIQKHSWEKALPDIVSEESGISHDRHVRQNGVGETILHPEVVEDSGLAGQVFVDDTCPNRKNDSADVALDEVLEQDQNDEVEIDVFGVMEDKDEDPEDKYVENVAVVVGRKQRENVKVVGRIGSC